MTNKDYFFCYDKKLFSYIKDVKKIDYITIAKNPATDNTFSMFLKTSQLQNAIDEYKTQQQT